MTLDMFPPPILIIAGVLLWTMAGCLFVAIWGLIGSGCTEERDRQKREYLNHLGIHHGHGAAE